MGWTEERVELLKRLWLEGQSASQIALQLGGVTRNAVIGKVHRLGLSGRATPFQPAQPELKAPRPARPATNAMPAEPPPAREDEPEAVVEDVEAPVVVLEAPDVVLEAPPEPAVVTASAAEPVATPEESVATAEPEIELAPEQAVEEMATSALVVPAHAAATVLTLGARMCKWPIGDPSTSDFGFCGRRSSSEGPYCVEHARLAYQPQQTRKKSAGGELARSLRRYV
jgi:GcrA cell cycle regulator